MVIVHLVLENINEHLHYKHLLKYIVKNLILKKKKC